MPNKLIKFFKTNSKSSDVSEPIPSTSQMTDLPKPGRVTTAVKKVISSSIKDAITTLTPDERKALSDALLEEVGNRIGPVIVTTTVVTTLCNSIAYYFILRDKKAFYTGISLALLEIFGINPICGSILVSAIGHYLTRVEREHKLIPSTQAPESEDESVINVLAAFWQAVSVAIGVSDKKPKTFKQFCKTVFDRYETSSCKVDRVAKALSNLLGIFRKMYYWILDQTFGITHYDALLYRDSRVLELWGRETTELLDLANEDKILTEPRWAARLEMVYSLSVFIQRQLLVAKSRDVPPNFFKLVEKIEILRNKVINTGGSHSLRREPVCVWVSGDPGLGKTFIKERLISKLLNSVNIPNNSNSIYSYTSGQKHWTGIANKKVVLFDDIATVGGQALTEDMAAFMRLVSDAPFAPEQAAIEDKGKCVAPHMVYVNANFSYNYRAEILQNGAFNRRRHILCELKPNNDFRAYGNVENPGAIEWINMHKTDNNPCPHLEFRFRDPQAEESASGPWLNYVQFETEIINRFRNRWLRNHDQHCAKVNAYLATFDTAGDLPLSAIIDNMAVRSDLFAYGKKKIENGAVSIWNQICTYQDKSVAVAKDWLSEIKACIASTQMGDNLNVPDECTCNISRLMELACLDGELIDTSRQEVVENPYCNEVCALRDLDRLEAWRGAFASGVTRKLIDFLITKVPNSSKLKRRYTYPDVAVDDAVISFVTSQRKEVPEKKWPPTYITIGISLGALAIVASAVYGLYSVFTRSAGPSQVTQLVSSGDTTTSGIPSQKLGITIKTLNTQVVEDIPLVQNADVITRLIDNNIVYLHVVGVKHQSNATSSYTFRLFGLKGKFVLGLKHYKTAIQSLMISEMYYIDSRGTMKLTVNHNDIKYHVYADSELCVFEFPANIPSSRDITSHIMSEVESNGLRSQCYAYEKELGNVHVLHPLHVSVQHNMPYKHGDLVYSIPTVLSYKWEGNGRCMTPIFCRLTSNKIVAFHFAGGNGTGMAEPVLVETFGKLLAGTVAPAPLPLEEYATQASPAVTLDGMFLEPIVVKSKYAARPATKSVIVPSLIHGYVEPLTQPAPLTPKDVDRQFSPLISGCNNNGNPPKPFSSQMVSDAKEYLRDLYLAHCVPARPVIGLLTEEEAVLGIPGNSGYPGLDMTTSEGFPFTAYRKSTDRNKSYQFNIEEIDGSRKLVSIVPELRRRIDSQMALREEGIVPETVFTDCLKDNRIKKSKYYVPGKTRIFSISPSDFTISFKQYFGDLIASSKLNRLNMHHAVGINVHSLEWTVLGRKLQEKGPALLCGDYTNFGPSLAPDVVNAVGEVWVDWYRHHERKAGVDEKEIARRALVRKVMFEEIKFSQHLVMNLVVKNVCGSPSGAPPTVHINTDVNIMYIVMAWRSIFSTLPLYRSYVSFRKYVNMYCYGDDLIMNVGEEVLSHFNNESLQKFFCTYSIKYTDDTKSDSIVKYTTLEEATFLKCHWNVHPVHSTILLAALDRTSIEDCANWIRDHPDKLSATRQAMYDSLMLAYETGEAFFKQHRSRLLQAWQEHGLSGDLTLYTWDDMDRMRFGYIGCIVPSLELAIEREREWRAKQKSYSESGLALVSLMTSFEQTIL